MREGERERGRERGREGERVLGDHFEMIICAVYTYLETFPWSAQFFQI